MMAEWIVWQGGKCPVGDKQVVKIRTAIDEYTTSRPGRENWNSDEDLDRIQAYKLLDGAPVTVASHLLAEAVETIERAQQDIHIARSAMLKRGHDLPSLKMSGSALQDAAFLLKLALGQEE